MKKKGQKERNKTSAPTKREKDTSIWWTKERWQHHFEQILENMFLNGDDANIREIPVESNNDGPLKWGKWKECLLWSYRDHILWEIMRFIIWIKCECELSSLLFIIQDGKYLRRNGKRCWVLDSNGNDNESTKSLTTMDYVCNHPSFYCVFFILFPFESQSHFSPSALLFSTHLICYVLIAHIHLSRNSITDIQCSLFTPIVKGQSLKSILAFLSFPFIWISYYFDTSNHHKNEKVK